MHKISSLFGGGSSVQTYDATVRHSQSTATVHNTYDSSHLGLPAYNGYGVTVSSGTLAMLADATWANRVVKSVIPSGAGNQKTDIINSSGESWARLHLANAKYKHGGSTNHLKRAQEFQGGNCAVHASVAAAALQSRGVRYPVSRVRASLPDGNSHEFLLLGDRRQSGDRNTVVVDSWPTYPSACTLDQAILHDASSGTHHPVTHLLESYRNEIWESPVDSADVRRLTKIKVLGTDDLNEMLRKAKLPKLDSEQLVNRALSDDRFGQFDVRVATDPSTLYKADSGTEWQSFDPILR
ncbi:hypothetical protein [Pseudomonas syringae]|uniref:hypothetical protein n=1 Tax=Pseudomonas syringae TaxID=317 RepID=UPI0009B2F37F|nr:hypothetical protein [Pseudomonas syringae]MCH5555685.1 hypothetical protein [Pseudomonas syringae pv. syringae]MCH5576331.1 hypothetical protein [Pseudomonas syringae pv. syringae]MCH5668452.1 hypothetical protein [Pseudomonas syringae pv. syringae]MDF5774123.1 hypothetical protein [Pseudomonas syringae pv. syringae]